MPSFLLKASRPAFALGLSLFLLPSCQEEPAAAPKASGPVKVISYSVRSQEFVDSITAVGTLRADESIEVSSNVTERIEKVLFEDGQKVAEGDLLVLLATSQETAMLDSAKASLAEAQREADRLRPLVQSGATSDYTLAERETQKTVAEAKIAEMNALVGDRRITAPFSGNVGLRRISPGALVEPGTVITTLDKTDQMKLDFTVPEVFLATLQPGLDVQGRSSAFADRLFPGTIATVDSRVDPVTRSVAVRAMLDNPDGSLRPGMLMTVRLERNPRTSLVVPERCIVPVRNDRYVFKITDEGTVSRVKVKTGSRIPGFVEILDGLSENDRIVSDGVLSLREGAEITVAGEFEEPVEAFDPTNGAQS
ncbi:MAG: efflux RND transporter periplasmic adaptor subunit [Verrucomicrobiales bacterium]